MARRVRLDGVECGVVVCAILVRCANTMLDEQLSRSQFRRMKCFARPFDHLVMVSEFRLPCSTQTTNSPNPSTNQVIGTRTAVTESLKRGRRAR